MTQVNKDNLTRLTELITKIGVPSALLFAVLYFVRTDLIVPLVETTRTLSVAYDKLASAMETQTAIIKEIRDERRGGPLNGSGLGLSDSRHNEP